jgi:hypothetical protein
MAKTSCLTTLRSAEPVVFLYAFGLLIHSPLIQQYIYDRVSEDKGYNNSLNSRTECASDSDLHDEVCSFIISLIFSQFIYFQKLDSSVVVSRTSKSPVYRINSLNFG